MNNPPSGFRLVGLLVPALMGALISCGEPSGSSPYPEPLLGVQKDTNDMAPGSLERADPRVTIEDFKFEPARLVVRPGTKVTWINKDDEPHSATSSEKPKRFDSGALDTAESFSFTFTEPGSFSYFCKLHPHMTAVVVVQ